MRNADKIKSLEKELGRYRKKVADQDRIIKGLEDMVETANAGDRQMHMAVDAILAQAAVKYGAPVRDEESGEPLGYRLVLPAFSIEKTLNRFEVRARRDEEAAEYVIGAMERREEA